MPDGFIIIYSTFPNKKTAVKIIKMLIAAKLAACGSMFELDSLYVWKKKTERAREWGAFIKTKSRNYKKVEEFILRHHPYEVPEIVSWDIKRGSKSYLHWIKENTI
ncbi:MAG TPA: divalent-cation tolerance protein CutA [bacterium]